MEKTRFCAEEIQKDSKPEEDNNRIEVVLCCYHTAGKHKMVVRWHGFPAKFGKL